MKVLITVKTYPIPSLSHKETVCTAGVLPDGSWVRLYPIDYRYKPYWEWYSKYQWIEIAAERHPHDPREETYRPIPDRRIVLGEKLDTERGLWSQRRKYVLAKGSNTQCELNRMGYAEKSLAVVRPREVFDLIIVDDEPDWDSSTKNVLNQQCLFGPQKKPLEKIPFKFTYHFTCADSECKGHKISIYDWEIGQLYRTLRDRGDTPDDIKSKIKQKFFNMMCSPDRDTHFYVGTHRAHGTWLILGVFLS